VALSAQDLDQFEVAARAANAQWKSAKARRDLAALLLQKTRVVAPDAGVISARAATTGAVVPAGTELFRLIRQSRLEWRAEIAEGNLAAVRPGVRVELTTAQGRVMTGKVRALSPKVDARNRTVLAYVDLPGADRYAAAGTFANGRFLLGDAPALTLPQSAVVLRDGLAYVFKLGKDDQVQRLRVVTGRRQADRIEILTGLAAGVRVVAAGAGFLNDADYVRVVSGPAL
jgi:RND family efflux transporter MFP subunit